MSTSSITPATILAEVAIRVVVSRALSPDVAVALGLSDRSDVVALPTVRGRTVWGATDDAAVVVEHPNGFGRPELIPSARMVMIVLAGGAPPPEARSDYLIRAETIPGVLPGFVPSADDYGTATARARRFALLLGQLPRFRLAHGTPRSPAFVAMFPCDPQQVTSAFVTSTHLAAAPIAERLPELPGGVLIRVEAAASERTLREQAAVLEKLVRQGE